MYDMETLIDNVEYRMPGDWMRMWNLHIPQRIKVFLWSLLRGVLPSHIWDFKEGGVPSSDYCPCCETNYENDWHIFIGCEVGKQVWIEAGLWDTITAGIGSATGLAAHLFSIFCRLPNELCRDIAALLWCLWRCRNDKVWEGEVQNVGVVVQLARKAIYQWEIMS